MRPATPLHSASHQAQTGRSGPRRFSVAFSLSLILATAYTIADTAVPRRGYRGLAPAGLQSYGIKTATVPRQAERRPPASSETANINAPTNAGTNGVFATTGLEVTKTCPTTPVGGGSSFQCTYTMVNLDNANPVTGLTVRNDIPDPLNASCPGTVSSSTSVPCEFPAGTPVTTLQPAGTAGDTCSGTLNETAPACGSSDCNLTDRVFGSGTDTGVTVTASTGGFVVVQACTPTPTNTPTNTPPNTPTNTPTNTPPNTPTNTPTLTNTPSNTPTLASTPTNTPPNTPTNTPTATPTPTSTRTATASPLPTATPTPTPIPVFSVSIPVVAHRVGANNAVFLTDLDIQNPNDVTVAAALIFSPNGGAPPIQAALTLAPSETRTVPDAARALFGVTNSFGGLRVETAAAAGQSPPVLVVTSRTYDEATGFGLSISGDANLVAQTSPSYVTGVQSNDNFRTQLGAFNITDTAETFVIALRGPDGSLLGTSSPILLGPFDQYQNGVKDLFPGVFPSATDGRRTVASSAASGEGLTAEFRPVGSSTVPVGYGNVADNHSSDLTYYKASQPGSVWYLPIFSRVTGRGGTVFKTELNLKNTSNISSLLTLTFFERDRDNTSGAKVASVQLNANETKKIDDAMLQLFGLSNTLGSIKIESDQSQSLVVGGRIFADSANPLGGTVGQQVDPAAPNEFYKNLALTGLKQNAGFRSVVGLFNPKAVTVAVTLSLKRLSGAQMGSRPVFLSPQNMIYLYLTDLFPDVVLPSDESMSLKLDASDKIAAFGIIVGNTSLDLTYSKAQSTSDPRSKELSISASQLPWNVLAGALAAGLWLLRQIV